MFRVPLGRFQSIPRGSNNKCHDGHGGALNQRRPKLIYYANKESVTSSGIALFARELIVVGIATMLLKAYLPINYGGIEGCVLFRDLKALYRKHVKKLCLR